MDSGLVPTPPRRDLARAGFEHLPAAIVRASWRFVEFFTANIRNKNTPPPTRTPSRNSSTGAKRAAFSSLTRSSPSSSLHNIEQHPLAARTVKQHLAARRMLFDWLVTGHVMEVNLANSVRGPKSVVKHGKTPVLTADQARTLLDSIETDSIFGLSDCARIGLMVFSFAWVTVLPFCRLPLQGSTEGPVL